MLIAVFAYASAQDRIYVTVNNVQPGNAGGGEVFVYCGTDSQVSDADDDMSLAFPAFVFEELLGYIYVTAMQDGRVATGYVNWNINMDEYELIINLPGIVPVKPIDPIKKG